MVNEQTNDRTRIEKRTGKEKRMRAIDNARIAFTTTRKSSKVKQPVKMY